MNPCHTPKSRPDIQGNYLLLYYILYIYYIIFVSYDIDEMETSQSIELVDITFPTKF